MRSTTESWGLRLRSVLGVSALLAAFVGCGGENLLLPSSGQPAQITVLDGNGQTGTVGQALANPWVVRVTDPENRPVEGVEVAFIVPAGATVTPNDTVLTGADGTASVQYQLATASGQYTIEARAKPVVPSPSLTTTISVIAVPEAAVQLVPARGDQQEGELLTALAESLAVKAVDRFGNGVAGIEVAWQVSDGAVSPETATTDADGLAATQRTLGSRPGLYRTSAEAELEGSPVSFEATGIAPPSPRLVLVTQPSPSATAGVPFERQPVLQLQDAVGSPLARGNLAVTVQIAEGEGSLGGTTTARSNGEGRVTFTDLSIGGRPGSRTLLFAAVEFTPVTSDEIVVSVGLPAPSRTSVSVSNGTAGVTTTASIHLEDQFGTAVTGAAGAIRVRVEGANSADAPVTEAGNGDYTASYTPSLAGSDAISVEVNGIAVPGSPFASAVSTGPPAASGTSAVVTRSGGFFVEVNILVTVRDAQGNLIRRGGDRVQVQIEGSDLRDARDNGDGTYSDRFVTILTSPTIIITLNGQQISGSPYGP